MLPMAGPTELARLPGALGLPSLPLPPPAEPSSHCSGPPSPLLGPCEDDRCSRGIVMKVTATNKIGWAQCVSALQRGRRA